MSDFSRSVWRSNSSPPVGILALIGLFAVGTGASASGVVALLLPGTALDHVWRINPQAHVALLSLGSVAVALMLAVCLACCLAAVGLSLRLWWGHRLAVGILAVNVVGDALNAVLRDDLRTLIGVPIGAAFIVYLLRPGIARLYGRTANAQP
jgi:hypothetical protein